MTKACAEKILANPKFGDPQCIAAMECLAQEQECERLRKLVIGRYVCCPNCSGPNDYCGICKPPGAIQVSRQLADSWDLNILQEVCDEIGVKR